MLSFTPGFNRVGKKTPFSGWQNRFNGFHPPRKKNR